MSKTRFIAAIQSEVLIQMNGKTMSQAEYVAWLDSLVVSVNELVAEIKKMGCYVRHPSVQRAINQVAEVAEKYGMVD